MKQNRSTELWAILLIKFTEKMVPEPPDPKSVFFQIYPGFSIGNRFPAPAPDHPLGAHELARVPQARSCPSRRWSDAGVRVGMLKGAGDSLT